MMLALLIVGLPGALPASAASQERDPALRQRLQAFRERQTEAARAMTRELK